MKAFLVAVVASVVIALAAAGVLRGWLDWSAASVYQAQHGSVRL